jgi:predicted dehydrogenase
MKTEAGAEDERPMKPLVKNPYDIRIAMVGMVEENAHPYSWSAIFNGFDDEAMAECPAPVVPQYLKAEPQENIGIAGARVTHIWCDHPEAARHVAKASLIPHVVDRPEDVIGKVDAVIIPTDIGSEHLERARPFIEAGLPVFVDKPLTDREEHLRQFVKWQSEGKAILSSSVLRYGKEYADCRERISEIGHLRLITMATVKSWERYGIHAAEAVYPFLPAGGWMSVANTGSTEANIVHVRHASRVDVVLAAIDDLDGSFGCLGLYGTAGMLNAKFEDKFSPLKKQLESFVAYLRSGRPPVAFAETVELMKIIIAGIRSRDEGGRRVELSEIEV